jgi:hypothetical protein
MLRGEPGPVLGHEDGGGALVAVRQGVLDAAQELGEGS